LRITHFRNYRIAPELFNFLFFIILPSIILLISAGTKTTKLSTDVILSSLIILDLIPQPLLLEGEGELLLSLSF